MTRLSASTLRTTSSGMTELDAESYVMTKFAPSTLNTKCDPFVSWYLGSFNVSHTYCRLTHSSALRDSRL